MVSRSWVFGLLVGSCVAAAGGGAYLATLQHVRSSTVAASSIRTPAAQAPQPVASDPAVSAKPADTGSVAKERENPAATTDRPGGAAAPAEPSPAKMQAPLAVANRQSGADIPAPVPRPVEAASASQGGMPVPAPAAPPQAGDPGSAAPRPWPGPPASAAAPVPPLSAGGEPGRPESEAAVHGNVKLWEELVVPSESVLGLQLESSLNTEQAHVEDRVDARVTRDVRVDGRVAIPAGSHVIGSVMLVDRGGRMKERARIGIRFDTLVLADGMRVSISTDTLYRESESPANKTSAKIGGAAIGGAIIGAIIGGGKGAAIGSGIGAAGGTAAAMTAQRIVVVLPAGTMVSVRTQAPITVTVEK
jgi:hypothetical protein